MILRRDRGATTGNAKIKERSICKLFFYFLLVTFSLASIGASAAVTRAEEFYQGKTVRFIVGFAPGGGYDAYTRLVARYISRYIPRRHRIDLNQELFRFFVRDILDDQLGFVGIRDRRNR